MDTDEENGKNSVSSSDYDDFKQPPDAKKTRLYSLSLKASTSKICFAERVTGQRL